MEHTPPAAPIQPNQIHFIDPTQGLLCECSPYSSVCAYLSDMLFEPGTVCVQLHQLQQKALLLGSRTACSCCRQRQATEKLYCTNIHVHPSASGSLVCEKRGGRRWQSVQQTVSHVVPVEHKVQQHAAKCDDPAERPAKPPSRRRLS